jgi:hypothetical protein
LGEWSSISPRVCVEIRQEKVRNTMPFGGDAPVRQTRFEPMVA